jgi:hypothetical protein
MQFGCTVMHSSRGPAMKILIHAPYKVAASESAAIQKVIGDTLLVVPVDIYNPKSKAVCFWGPTYEILENRIVSVMLPNFTFAKKIKQGKEMKSYPIQPWHNVLNDSIIIQPKSKLHFEIHLPLKIIVDSKCSEWQLIYLETKYPNNWRFRPLCDKTDGDLYPDFPYIVSNTIHLK